MANTIQNSMPYSIVGDGVSLTAVIPLGYTPTTATYVSAYTANGDATANVASVVISGTNLNVTFNTAFSGLVTLLISIAPVTPTIQATGSFWQTTQPVSLASMPSTPVTGTFWQTTQPVSIATMPTTPVTGTFWQTTQPVSLAANTSVNFTQLNGVALGSPSNYGTSPGAVAVEGVNAFITNTPAVTVSSGTVTTVSTVTALTTVTNPVKVEGNAGATLDGVMNGAASTNMLWTASAPSSASAAACSFKFINASGAAVSVKASAGNLYGFTLTNNTAAVAFVEFFNIASAPTLGTTAVVMAFEIPASSFINIPPSTFALGNFATGIGFGCTTAENGSTAASVTGVLYYL